MVSCNSQLTVPSLAIDTTKETWSQEQVALDCQNKKLMKLALRGKSTYGHMHVRVYSHTHTTTLLSYTAGKPPQLSKGTSGCCFIL